MSEPIDAFDAVMRLEEGLDDAIEPIVEYWRLHEREMPRELARLIERLAEVKAECDAASMLIRFDPFTGEGVKKEQAT